MALTELVQLTRQGLRKEAVKLASSLKNGYGYCPSPELLIYEKAVTLLRNQQLVGEVCLCQQEIDVIESNIHRLLPNCKVVEKDYTREPRPDLVNYLSKNTCKAYDYYADYLDEVCKSVDIDFKVVQKKCEDVDIKINITDKIVMCALDLALEIKEHKCDIDIDPKISIQDCIVDIAIAAEKHNCDIDVKTYVEKLSCGVDVQTILSQLDCTADVSVDIGPAVNCPASSSPSPSSSASPSPEPIDDFTITVSDATICYYTDVTLEIEEPEVGVTYEWSFGSGASVASATGAGPHTIQYTTNGTKTVTVTGTNGEYENDTTANIAVSSCPGNVTGSVEDSNGAPLAGVNVRVFNDANADGVSDGGAAVKSTFTTSSGGYAMTGIAPGNYVVQVNAGSLSGYTIVSGIDDTADGDVVVDADTGDVTIPLTMKPNTVDANNNFVFRPNDGVISGNVLDNVGNPVVGATVNIYADDDEDGAADDAVVLYSGVTNPSGVYSISGVTTAGGGKHYVIVLDVPIGYTIVSGIDTSNDLDTVPNTDTTNNIIPCSLNPGETDANNNFVITL